MKGSKTKFGVEKVTFHNYTITKEGTQPKDANLCPIRNLEYLGDVSQVRAFLGCCQQMSQYIKNYGIIAAPLHALTKKAVAFPKPWKENEVYSKAFRELKAAILDSENFLHHKDPLLLVHWMTVLALCALVSCRPLPSATESPSQFSTS